MQVPIRNDERAVTVAQSDECHANVAADVLHGGFELQPAAIRLEDEAQVSGRFERAPWNTEKVGVGALNERTDCYWGCIFGHDGRVQPRSLKAA